MFNSELPVYVFDPLNKPITFDFNSKVEAWFHCLNQELMRSTGATGYYTSPTKADSYVPYPNVEFRPTTESLSSALRIVTIEHSDKVRAIYLFIVSNKPEIADELIIWNNAIDGALNFIENDYPEFHWHAILGVIPGSGIVPTRLSRRQQIGGMKLYAKNSYLERSVSRYPSMYTDSFTYSWPIIIEGKTKGYDWFPASRSASEEIYKVILILSLAFKKCFCVKNAVRENDGNSINIPKAQSGLEQSRSNFLHRKAELRQLPKWAICAYENVSSKPRYKNALAAHHQGLMMEINHPSFALAAFACSIEIVGGLIVGEKCSTCGRENSSNQKFRAALSSVISDKDEVKRLSQLYKSRSKTVHEGVLHGEEHLPGSLPNISIFATDPDFIFVANDLTKLREVNQKILEKLLKGQLKLSDQTSHLSHNQSNS